jgi:hypothetical protein
MTSFEEEEVDDVDFEMGRSDILLFPAVSDGEDGGISSHPDLEFQEVVLLNPNLQLKIKFYSIQFFRESIRQYNVRKRKDIKFVKNERAKCVGVCIDPSCEYRVYGRQMMSEESFEIKSLRPKHSCARVCKSSIVNSKWVANKLFDKFKI